jgi:dTDP-4-amino-4,6-dideoxygalactose transaminase
MTEATLTLSDQSQSVSSRASRKTIPFFDYPELFLSQRDEMMKIFEDVGRRGAFILQKDVRDFEETLEKYLGVKHAVGVANCTDGLIICLKAAGLKAGDEVIISSHTFIATAAAVHHAGGIPVPVECGDDHLIDPDSVQSAITPKTRFLMPTQLNGRTANMDLLQAIAEKYGLTIVEDAAQALGSHFKGKFAGTFGAASAFSFYPAKNLGALGDAGAMISNDSEIYEKMLLLRNHGRLPSGEVAMWSLNSRLDNLQAAILQFRFKSYNKIIEHRRSIASVYDQELKSMAHIKLPPGPDDNPNHFDVFQNYEIQADRRDELQAYLKENGIGTLIQWSGWPVHQMKSLGFTQQLPKTDELFRKILMIPMNMSVTEADARFVAGKVREFYS